MKCFKKILIWIIILAIYLNIGWALGTYCYYHVFYVKPDTFFDKTLAGGWEMLSHPHSEKAIEQQKESLLGDQILCSTIWPAVFIIILITWILYFLWEILAVIVIWKFLFCTVIWGLLKLIFSLGNIIFAGGGAELVHDFFVWEKAWAIGFCLFFGSSILYVIGKEENNESLLKGGKYLLTTGATILTIALLVKWL